MAASAWTLYDRAKHRICTNEIVLSGGNFRLALYRQSASASVSLSAITIQSELGSQASGGAYTAGGKAVGTVRWTAGTSAGQQKWDISADTVFTASGSNISLIQYGVLVYSVGATSGFTLCWSKLSTSAFSVTTGNTLTVQYNASGVFTLA